MTWRRPAGEVSIVTTWARRDALAARRNTGRAERAIKENRVIGYRCNKVAGVDQLGAFWSWVPPRTRTACAFIAAEVLPEPAVQCNTKKATGFCGCLLVTNRRFAP